MWIIISVVMLLVIGLGIRFYYVNSKRNKVPKVKVNKENLFIDKLQAKEEKHIKIFDLFSIYYKKRILVELMLLCFYY